MANRSTFAFPFLFSLYTPFSQIGKKITTVKMAFHRRRNHYYKRFRSVLPLISAVSGVLLILFGLLTFLAPAPIDTNNPHHKNLVLYRTVHCIPLYVYLHVLIYDSELFSLVSLFFFCTQMYTANDVVEDTIGKPGEPVLHIPVRDLYIYINGF